MIRSSLVISLTAIDINYVVDEEIPHLWNRLQRLGDMWCGGIWTPPIHCEHGKSIMEMC